MTIMRKFRYTTASVVLTSSFLIASFALGCGGADSSGPTETTPTTPTTTLMAASATVAVGGSVQRRVFIGNQLIANAVWKSADNAIATVSNSGIVTGVAAGKTTIEASAGDNKWTAEITVADLKLAAAKLAHKLTAGSGIAGATTASPRSVDSRDRQRSVSPRGGNAVRHHAFRSA